MASSSGFGGNTRITFGTTTPPVVTGEETDNDSYIVTNDGTATGVPTEFWKFDDDTNTWIQIPSGGAPVIPCQVETTRAAIRALRTAGNLVKDCHYVLTDYSRGTVGAAKILLHAVDEDTLSLTALVKTSFDNLAWDGLYDIDANRLERLQDNIGNDVRGGDAIDNFPWGVAAVNENQVYDARLNYTVGTVTENTLDSGATLTVVSGSVRNNHVKSRSVVTVNAGTFAENTVGEECSVTINSGLNYENRFGTSCVYNQVGTGYIRYTSIDGNGTVTNGNINISSSRFIDAAAIDTTGSTGVISNCTIGYSSTNGLKNIPTLTIQQSSITEGSQIAADNALRLRLSRTQVTSGARVLVSAGARLDTDYCKLDSNAYVQVLAGFLNMTFSQASSRGYFYSAAGNNRIDRCSVSSQANMSFNGTTTGCRMYYSEAHSGGRMFMTDCTNTYFYYSRCISLSDFYAQDRTNVRAYYNSAQDRAYLRMYGTGAGQNIIYYCSVEGVSYLDQINAAARIRFYGCHVAARSVLRMTGNTTNVNIYYSSLTAYYYLQLTAAATGSRQGLHGYGRQTFNGWPTTNGTALRNWP